MSFEAMSRVVTEADEKRYLESLNICFPGWGAAERYDWCFRRSGDGVLPELFLLTRAGEPVVGSAISYRRLGLADGRSVRVGIMTGSWTLPSARGKGAFSRIIEESLVMAARREASLLLAFVTSTNASCRRLEAAGAMLIPTFYARSSGAVETGAVTQLLRASLGRFEPMSGINHFDYSDADWTAQFLGRPEEVDMVGSREGWRAIVERGPADDRILAFDGDESQFENSAQTLTARAAAAGRRLFTFTADPARCATLRHLGFEIVEGFLTILPASGNLAPPIASALTAAWRIENGDRM